ncbi:MAG: hypothetical protein LBS14_00850 [Holosporaceae bacterium]|jgi:hypothetical protein|nr:hypothetical protein [Holosporaceae bacterium]
MRLWKKIAFILCFLFKTEWADAAPISQARPGPESQDEDYYSDDEDDYYDGDQEYSDDEGRVEPDQRKRPLPFKYDRRQNSYAAPISQARPGPESQDEDYYYDDERRVSLPPDFLVFNLKIGQNAIGPVTRPRNVINSDNPDDSASVAKRKRKTKQKRSTNTPIEDDGSDVPEDSTDSTKSESRDEHLPFSFLLPITPSAIEFPNSDKNATDEEVGGNNEGIKDEDESESYEDEKPSTIEDPTPTAPLVPPQTLITETGEQPGISPPDQQPSGLSGFFSKAKNALSGAFNSPPPLTPTTTPFPPQYLDTYNNANYGVSGVGGMSMGTPETRIPQSDYSPMSPSFPSTQDTMTNVGPNALSNDGATMGTDGSNAGPQTMGTQRQVNDILQEIEALKRKHENLSNSQGLLNAETAGVEELEREIAEVIIEYLKEHNLLSESRINYLTASAAGGPTFGQCVHCLRKGITIRQTVADVHGTPLCPFHEETLWQRLSGILSNETEYGGGDGVVGGGGPGPRTNQGGSGSGGSSEGGGILGNMFGGIGNAASGIVGNILNQQLTNLSNKTAHSGQKLLSQEGNFVSVGDSSLSSTPNGYVVDPTTGVFSPAPNLDAGITAANNEKNRKRLDQNGRLVPRSTLPPDSFGHVIDLATGTRRPAGTWREGWDAVDGQQRVAMGQNGLLVPCSALGGGNGYYMDVSTGEFRLAGTKEQAFEAIGPGLVGLNQEGKLVVLGGAPGFIINSNATWQQAANTAEVLSGVGNNCMVLNQQHQYVPRNTQGGRGWRPNPNDPSGILLQPAPTPKDAIEAAATKAKAGGTGGIGGVVGGALSGVFGGTVGGLLSTAVAAGANAIAARTANSSASSSAANQNQLEAETQKLNSLQLRLQEAQQNLANATPGSVLYNKLQGDIEKLNRQIAQEQTTINALSGGQMQQQTAAPAY